MAPWKRQQQPQRKLPERVRLIAPLGKLVAGQPLSFRWEAVPTATRYELAAFDEDGRLLWTVLCADTAAPWPAQQPMPTAQRGFRWRVTALTPGGAVVGDGRVLLVEDEATPYAGPDVNLPRKTPPRPRSSDALDDNPFHIPWFTYTVIGVVVLGFVGGVFLVSNEEGFERRAERPEVRDALQAQPRRPTLVTLDGSMGSTRPNLRWSAVPQARAYHLSITAPDGTVLLERSTAATTLAWPDDVAALERGLTYRWSVTAIAAGGPVTDEGSFQVRAQPR